MAFRAVRGLSQGDIAKSMGCTQSRVSKLERGMDADIRLEDLGKYANAVNMELRLVFAERRDTIVDEVKFHAFRIKALLERLAKLARKDERIARGVGSFFGEAFFNLLNIIQSSAKQLPPREDGRSLIQIEVQECHEQISDDSDCREDQDHDCEDCECEECLA